MLSPVSEMTSKFDLSNSYKLFDRELVITKKISGEDIIGGISKFSSFKVFHDPFQNISYIKMNKEDPNYYSIKKYVLTLGLKIKEVQDEEVVEVGALNHDEMNFLKELSSIPGIMRYPFSIIYGKTQYFRFLLLNESIYKMTRNVLDFIDSHEDWEILYLREPESIESYLRRYHYEKSVKFFILKELDYVNIEETFPHYKCEHIFYLLLGEPNLDKERAIRFSLCETEKGGIISENRLIRDNELKIYEDIRYISDISFVNIIKNPYYSFPLETIQYFDGKNIFMRILIDKDDEKILFNRLIDYNKKETNKVKFLIDECWEVA